jgi:hypothetical protein
MCQEVLVINIVSSFPLYKKFRHTGPHLGPWYNKNLVAPIRNKILLTTFFIYFFNFLILFLIITKNTN